MIQLKPAVNGNDHIWGNSNAPLELVEYGDFQCEHCGYAYPIIKNIQRKLGTNLKFVFRNFPLSEIHQNAVNAALATEAAGLQDKFWEMFDIIFENQNALDDESIFSYAQKIGLDLKRFKNDIQKTELVSKVEQDFESGLRSGVNGTPTFFINGKKYNGDWEEHVLFQYLKSQMTGASISQ